jgi:MarR family 2-MHQ and catechol resistance regulon transcriptional repressor
MISQHNATIPLTLHDKLLLGIVRAAERLKREQGSVFKEYGITFSQYNVLRVLHSNGKAEITTSNVSKQLLVSRASISSLLKRLERQGYISRTRDINDERVIKLKITKKGISVIDGIAKKKNESLNKIMGSFTDSEIRATLRILMRIVNCP